MRLLTTAKRMILVSCAVLAFPAGAVADGPPPEHGVEYRAHEHGMVPCPMMGAGSGPELGGHGMIGGEGMFGGEAMPPFMHRLGLTEAQQDRIFEILHAAAPQAREQGKALRKAHRNLHELVTSGTFEEAKAKAAADALGKATAESALLHARTHRQLWEVLTPEQRQMLAHQMEHGPDHEGPHSGYDAPPPPSH